MLNIFNHYWIIGGSKTEVYSSASNTMVPVSDKTYSEWAEVNQATPIGSEAELADVLAGRASPLPPWLLKAPSFVQTKAGVYNKEQLAAYARFVRAEKVSSEVDTEARLHALELYAAGDRAADELFTFVNGTYAKLADVLNGISGGSITKLEQITAAFG